MIKAKFKDLKGLESTAYVKAFTPEKSTTSSPFMEATHYSSSAPPAQDLSNQDKAEAEQGMRSNLPTKRTTAIENLNSPFPSTDSIRKPQFGMGGTASNKQERPIRA